MVMVESSLRIQLVKGTGMVSLERVNVASGTSVSASVAMASFAGVIYYGIPLTTSNLGTSTQPPPLSLGDIFHPRLHFIR